MKSLFALLIFLIKHRVKYSCAAIPSLIDTAISNATNEICETWQHGYSHKSYSNEKKSEYCEERDLIAIEQELIEGRNLLLSKFPNFIESFIPPWNRISDESLKLLEILGFKYFSADKKRETSLIQFHANLDLHTNKDMRFLSASEILRQMSLQTSGNILIMLHHNHMLESEFKILDELLGQLVGDKDYSLVWITELK